ncbi:MAG: type II toxin-antitoxin system HicB family antitoxin [Agriterribacter sp.]
MNDILKYKDYLASVHFSMEDEIFYGKVLGIDDLINFEGSSIKELKKAFHEAVDDYISTCKSLGKKPNKTYKGTFNVRIPSELHREAAAFAAVNSLSLNDFVKSAINFALANQEHLNKKLSLK